MGSNYSPAQVMKFMLQCIPNDMKYIIRDCKNLEEMLTKLSYYTSDEKTYSLKTIQEIKNSSESQTISEDMNLLQFFSKSLANLTKLSRLLYCPRHDSQIV